MLRQLTKRKVCLQDLPDDILLLMLSFLPGVDVGRVAQVARRFLRLSSVPDLWEKLTRARFTRVATGTDSWQQRFIKRHRAQQNWKRAQFVSHRFFRHNDGVTSLRIQNGNVVSGSLDRSVGLWSLKLCRRVAELRGHQLAVLSVATTESLIYSGSADATICMWDAKTQTKAGSVRSGLDGNVLALDVSSTHDTDTRVAAGIANGHLHVFDTNLRRIVDMPTPGASPHVVKFWEENVLLAGGADGAMRMYDVRVGRCVSLLKDVLKVDSGAGAVLCAAPISSDLLACGYSDGVIRLWDVRSRSLQGSLSGHQDAVLCLASDPTTGRLVSGSADTTVRIWNQTECTGVLQGVHSAAVTSVVFDDFKIVSSGAEPDNRIIICDFLMEKEHRQELRRQARACR
eukprot:TRINITY_DN15335_c0_g1_i1.p1 TRINITY_DN15335_c0_g1~~TRINITY_DN15335_c0_g1_i1.p1  ORF type:complete len:400 (-),score=59.68 TRINITY_DN15335_c0_g1_i1:4-1203(-)